METDPPADDLVAEIGHGNEVSGLNNDGGNAEGELYLFITRSRGGLFCCANVD